MTCYFPERNGVCTELVSKQYVYKDDITLELGVATSEGLRIDSVRFLTPSAGGGKMRMGDSMRAEVAVSNTSEEPLKVGLAIALFDDSERLLGVASGGTRLVPIKSGRSVCFRKWDNSFPPMPWFRRAVRTYACRMRVACYKLHQCREKLYSLLRHEGCVYSEGKWR